jgi:Tfp pilus assembly protein PilX
MKKRAILFRSRFVSEETGMALIIVLVLLVLGSLMMLPVLAHLNTALKTGQMYEEKSNMLYTADAGIEDALWRLKYDSMGPNYSEYDFDTVWSFETDLLNGTIADINIQNVWIPTNVTLSELGLDAESAETMIESEKLKVTGSSGAIPGEPYEIKIDFIPNTGDNLTVKSIGVWLPQGFEFISENNTLEANPAAEYYPDSVSVETSPGGSTTVWSYNSPYPLFTSFPAVDPEATIMSTNIEFCYTPPADDPGLLPSAIAWITTDMEGGTNDVPISWDMDTRIFHITSEAGDTHIDAYSSKCELRQMGDAMAGDYVAIGSSLMTDVSENIRYTLLDESSHDLTSIPEDADVIAAYLYWSAWKEASTQTNILSDSCSNFDNWDKTEGQTRVPTGDGDSTGTWNTAPCWDDVDETTPNDTDYMTGTDSESYMLFTSSNFTLPAGSFITNLTIYIRARDHDSGHGNNIRSSLKVGGDIYDDVFSGDNPGSGWTTYSYAYTTNPKTGLAWEVDDINGTGDNPLEQFGVYSNDLNPDVDVSMIYAEVNVGCWSIYDGWWDDDFQGQGASSAGEDERSLTLADCLDLSLYDPGTVVINWLQSESGTLEESDTLYFAMSSDNGTSWSDNIEVFSDDDPYGFFWYTVPDDYMTSGFKLRLYIDFDSADEYAHVDEIRVSYLPPDTEAYFEIDGDQVYYEDGEPCTEDDLPIYADSWQVMPSPFSSSFSGFSYSCFLDVSKLVKTYPIDEEEENHTGNAVYTVGDVFGSVGHHLSYAGWSLIIIYCSPETAGHYLYLRDTLAFNPGTNYHNLDFDFDGEDGGDITNFVIPEPIKDRYGVIIEDVAATITCFIGEGDECWDPEWVLITGEQSENSMYLSNSVSPWNNIWNGESPGMTYAGVDIDTFEILWEDQIFQPGDTTVHLDMVSNQDAWNFIYFIISVRSETVIGGTSQYIIYSG